MAEKKILGKNDILFIYAAIKDDEGANVAANYFPVACLTSNDISHSQAMTDGTVTKCNTSPDPTYGAYSYQITFEAENMEDDGLKASYSAVYDAMKLAKTSEGYIYFKIETTMSDDTKRTEFGKGYITELSRTSPAEGAETFSGTIRGSGELSATDLNV
jgi:hypothetical protein